VSRAKESDVRPLVRRIEGAGSRAVRSHATAWSIASSRNVRWLTGAPFRSAVMRLCRGDGSLGRSAPTGATRCCPPYSDLRRSKCRYPAPRHRRIQSRRCDLLADLPSVRVFMKGGPPAREEPLAATFASPAERLEVSARPNMMWIPDGTCRMGKPHLCAPNYCRRYRPAARHAEAVDTSTSDLGFRCVLRRRDRSIT
jgi:formylglycine-generating enzyme required for sulfatase activity